PAKPRRLWWTIVRAGRTSHQSRPRDNPTEDHPRADVQHLAAARSDGKGRKKAPTMRWFARRGRLSRYLSTRREQIDPTQRARCDAKSQVAGTIARCLSS